MKKIKKLCAVILGAILILSGCSSKEEELEGRTETLNSLGLEYTLPSQWDQIVDTNVFRFIVAPEGAFAMVRYAYATNDAINALTEETSVESGSLDDFVTPICSILIYDKENEGSFSVESLKAPYESSKLLSEQGSYVYCGLWDYKDTSKIQKGTLDESGYKKLSSSAQKLMDSVKTFDFDPEEILSQTTLTGKTLTFMSETLKGTPIDSRVFSDYDLTMVYFWGSYCYPDINELPTLQAVYEKLKAEGVNANLLLAVIDTPDEAAEEIAIGAMSDAGCTFDAFKMDNTIGRWVLDNLTGLPTTVFVNGDGEIMGEDITGLQNESVYLDSIYALLEN